MHIYSSKGSHPTFRVVVFANDNLVRRGWKWGWHWVVWWQWDLHTIIILIGSLGKDEIWVASYNLRWGASVSTFLGSYLVHILHLCVLIRLWGLPLVSFLPFVIFILTFNLHLNLLALAKLLVALLDQDTSTKLLWCGWWGEVAWKNKAQMEVKWLSLTVMYKDDESWGQITLFIWLEINRLNHNKVMPVYLCICHTFFFSFLFLLLPLTFLKLCPLDTVPHLDVSKTKGQASSTPCATALKKKNE